MLLPGAMYKSGVPSSSLSSKNHLRSISLGIGKIKALEVVRLYGTIHYISLRETIPNSARPRIYHGDTKPRIEKKRKQKKQKQIGAYPLHIPSSCWCYPVLACLLCLYLELLPPGSTGHRSEIYVLISSESLLQAIFWRIVLVYKNSTNISSSINSIRSSSIRVVVIVVA